jgi:pimeloyl-ACP methyl ester carboxylesterase
MIFDVFEKRRFKVDNIEVVYFDEGSGRAVLLIHGLGGYKENWTFTIKDIKNSFRAIAPDLPGFGDSEKPDIEYTMEFFADFLNMFLDKLGVDKVILVGNSMGGTIAILFTVKNPERVEKLVLVDSAGFRPKQIRGFVFDPKQFLEKGVAFRPPPEMVEFMVKSLLFVNPPKFADEMIKRSIKDWWESGESFMERSRAYLKSASYLFDFEVEELLETINKPTLIIWGAGDRALPVSLSDEFSKRLKKSKKFIIGNCGHVPMLEKPAEFSKVLLNFLLGSL